MPQPPASFGEIAGIRPGHEFRNRLELWGAGVHGQTQAGISARAGRGAESIVVSGGYEDDLDLGAWLLYTGKGGRSNESGRQVADQTLTGANLELARNQVLGLPVRVTRKVTENGLTFYRYGGLYRVASYWQEQGRSGHKIWRFRLELLPEEVLPAAEPASTALPGDLFSQAQEPALPYGAAPRQLTTTLRIVRDTAVSRAVKNLYAYRCQVCAVQLASPAGLYAEAAHVRPLGAPHHGPDVLGNVLCLCPNHHVLFDLGSFAVRNDFTLLGLNGKLTLHRRHGLEPHFLHYHREHYFHAPGAYPAEH
ncbi:YDG/SRA domain-containing protein [Hymenobacter elongatus]|uniref:HNH endonuclease n=1 Tax=Hymenobacter elongatus TaxID=877208 RepID=A0A4Z0PPE8_9BACT|nr:YDG/SRA domain-containing protein [Hymenobacter elongatus]TGE19347.1 HNH endonuclease [Hymenobacter elongatus]